ncbi:hypothetical protein Tco_1257380 [Tanacetum coccineum]
MMRRSDEEKETLKKEAHEAKKQCLEGSQRHPLPDPSLLQLLRSRPFFFCCSVPVISGWEKRVEGQRQNLALKAHLGKTESSLNWEENIYTMMLRDDNIVPK